MSQPEILEESFSSDEDLDDEDVSESSSDEDAKLEENDVFDIEFFKCYSALKKKDGKIYDKGVKFFEDQASGSENDEEVAMSNLEEPKKSPLNLNKTKNSKPKMTLLDHQLEMAKKGFDQDETLLPKCKIDLDQPVSKSFYDKELEEIKNSIAKLSEGVDSDSDDLLLMKGSNKTPLEMKPRKRIDELLDKLEQDEDQDISHLKQIWSNPDKLSEEDNFLRDYILNKRYIPKNNKEDHSSFFSKNLDELSDLDSEDDCQKVKKERQVDHHFDEKDSDTIARVPRNSTKTIRDLVEKREKKEKRVKKLEKEKKKRNNLKNADCEDIVGDLPTRFHYRETVSNDYGLSAEELLMATDEELDKWISLKDAIRYKSYDEEIEQKQMFESKRNDLELKKKIFASIYGDTVATDGLQVENNVAIKKKNTKRIRKDINQSDQSISAEATNDVDEPVKKKANSNTSAQKEKKKKHKRRGLNHKKFSKAGVAPDRLLSYGLSKSKLRKSKLL